MKESIRNKLLSLLKDTLPTQPNIDDVDTPLQSLGANSLIILRIKRAIDKTFNVDIPLKDFFNHLQTIDALANHICNYLPQKDTQDNEINHDQLPDDSLNHFSPESDIEYILNQQLKTASETIESVIQHQLQFLHQKGVPIDTKNALKIPSVSNLSEPKSLPDNNDFVDHSLVINTQAEQLSKKQIHFINELIKKYSSKTNKSKKHAQQYNFVLSDWINTLNYRHTLKEIQYPIVANKSRGSKIWDIDANEYIDMAMGYGVNYLGNSPLFIKDAVSEQLQNGFHLGPQFELTGKVCELITELAGVERITFCNSGTEAVMCAIRIARTVTKKNKIVIFSGSYHGTFDGILAVQGENGTIASSPGIPYGMIKDVVVLDYDSPRSLEYIKSRGHELAAVLTEPVQSRKPGLQPREFLTKLRQITAQTGTALIFDEVITGFRICQGGAQAHFNIRADIVVYGKILAGGMPVGVVAGNSKFLNTIDGGPWHFNDESFPSEKTTVFGGTFCKHPLTMAASLAALQFMKSQGPELQEKTNKLTAYFANTLNKYFKEENVPIRIQYFASVFRFESFGKYELLLQPLEMDILFYLLMHKGVYTWEKRICFFSIDHTYDDIQYIIESVKESILEMRQGGFSFEQEHITDKQKDKSSAEKSENLSNFSTPEKTYPMSSHQKRLFVLSQLENTESHYHVNGAIIIDGDLDMERLKKSFQEIIKRHESLRTAFKVQEEQFLQKVHENVDCNIVITKINQSQINSFIENFIAPFDLSCPPLIRIAVANVSTHQYLLVIDSHHIAIDGYSFNIIVEEFLLLYKEEKPDTVFRQYSQYAIFEQNHIKSDTIKKQEQYWIDQLSDELPVLNLPYDYPRQRRQSYQGSVIYFKIDGLQTEKLKELATRTHTTLFMVLLSGYNILLSRLSGQEDIIIGTPMDCRPDRFEKTIGMFVNTLVIRSFPVGSKTFQGFLNEVKDRCFDAYENHDLPFDVLMEKLNLQRDMSRNPLFDAQFVFEDGNQRLLKIENMTFTTYDIQKKSSMFDLTLEVIEREGHLEVSMEYCSKLFHRKTIIRWSDYYKTIINEIIKKPDIRISDIDILPDDEKNKLLHIFNNTKADYPENQTLVSMFENSVSRTPHNLALIFNDIKITYEQLNASANQLAHKLRKDYHIGVDDPVGIMVERSEMMIIGIFGILKAGGAYVPVHPEFPKERIQYMLDDCACKVILSDVKFIHILQDLSSAAVLDITQFKDNPTHNLNIDIFPTNLAYIIYTSGSTGQPKGVMIEHGSVINRIHWMHNKYPIHPDQDIILQKTPFTFDVSVWEIFWWSFYGVPLCLLEPNGEKEPEIIVNTIKKRRITVLHFVPPMLNAFIEYLEQNNNASEIASLKHVFASGEALSQALVKKFNNLLEPYHISLHNLYGPTEATVDVTYYDCSPDFNLPVVPIGKPIDNTQIYILDKSMKHLLPTGSVGEICIGGVLLARGYLNKPELTKEKFIPHPFKPEERIYRTGDLGKWRHDGNIEYLGRTDHQVKIRGFRIELGEIENALVRHHQINQAVVIARELDSGDKELIAYMENKNEISVSDLKAYLRNILPHYMLPTYYVFLENFPLNASGKIDRKNLPDPKMESDSSFVSPETDTEKMLAQIWETVLDRKKIGVHDNFFSIGGDSIKAIQIVSKANQKIMKIKVIDLFDNPTIFEMALYIKSQAQMKQKEIRPIHEKDPLLSKKINPDASDKNEPSTTEFLSEFINEDALNEILLTTEIPKENIQAIYPLSPTQEVMLFHAIYDSSSSSFLQVDSFRVTGNFNTHLFEKSWNELFKRYDIFRTLFLYKGLENPLQVVLKKQQIKFIFHDIKKKDKDQKAIYIKNCKQKETSQPFDLSRDTLMRMTIIAVSESAYEIIWTRHHILMDGWCSWIIVKDLFTIYDRLSKGLRIDLEPVIPYSSYIVWLQTQMDKKSAKQFWKAYLKDYQQMSTLTDPNQLKDPSGSYILKRKKEVLSENLTQSLNDYAARNKVTVNTVVKSIWAILLSKHSHSNDVVFGQIVSGRPPELPGVENIVGLFLNTIPVRITIDHSDHFTSLIQKVQKQFFQNEEFSYYSLAEIQAMSFLKEKLMDHIFVFENFPFSDKLMNIIDKFNFDFQVRDVEEVIMQTNYDLSVLCYPQDKMLFEIKYNDSVFSEVFISQILKQYIEMITAVLEDENILTHTLYNIRDSQARLQEDEFLKRAMSIDEDF